VEKQLLELILLFNEWLAVIGKGKRDEAAACQPALNFAKDNRMSEIRSGGRSCECDGFILICCLQGVQPTLRVKN
jgi:hypothetical protein